MANIIDYSNVFKSKTTTYLGEGTSFDISNIIDPTIDNFVIEPLNTGNITGQQIWHNGRTAEPAFKLTVTKIIEGSTLKAYVNVALWSNDYLHVEIGNNKQNKILPVKCWYIN